MIPSELEAEILRLYHAEGWRVGTISDQLNVHHEVVERVLKQDGIPRAQISRPAEIDKFVPFLQRTWEKHPRLPASTLWRMCKRRGYRGHQDHFRHMARQYRPRKKAEAFLRLKTLPGEQAQVDWGHFGHLQIGQAKRALMAFVLVLSWSRDIFLQFFLGQASENFLRGHTAAFEHWGGVPRVVLYDNLKSAVLEREGTAIRFNPLLIEYAKRYRYEPRPVAVARGNEKGRVERAIRYIRGAFFMARKWRDLDDLNAQALEWCMTEARERRWVEDDQKTVGAVFAEEQPTLFELPAAPFPTEERKEVRVGKTPYVRFDLNDYSVPHEHVRELVLVLADLQHVRILHQGEVIATHSRCFDRKRQIEDPAHIERLRQQKQAASRSRGLGRLCAAVPGAEELMKRLAGQGSNLGSATSQLLRLLDSYGPSRLALAIAEAIENRVAHPAAVRQILERNHRAEGQPPPVAVNLPDDPRIRDITVTPHDLSTYDNIQQTNEDTPDDEDNSCCPATR